MRRLRRPGPLRPGRGWSSAKRAGGRGSPHNLGADANGSFQLVRDICVRDRKHSPGLQNIQTGENRQADPPQHGAAGHRSHPHQESGGLYDVARGRLQLNSNFAAATRS